MWTTFLCLSFTHQRMLDWDAALLHLHLTTYYQLVGFSVLASWTTLRSSAAYDPSVSQSVFTIMEKAPYHKGRAALRHYAKQPARSL